MNANDAFKLELFQLLAKHNVDIDEDYHTHGQQSEFTLARVYGTYENDYTPFDDDNKIEVVIDENLCAEYKAFTLAASGVKVK